MLILKFENHLVKRQKIQCRHIFEKDIKNMESPLPTR